MRLSDYLRRIGAAPVAAVRLKPDATIETLARLHLAHREAFLTSTNPESVFRRTLTIQRSGRDERVILRSDALTRSRNGCLTEEPIDRSRLPRLARELFGVELPAGPFVFEQLTARVA